jgi:hypothetical protein
MVSPGCSTEEELMARRLLVVEHTFAIKGRGLVLVPGIIPEGDERFRMGDCIRLRKPDGSSIVTRIGGLELLCPNPRRDVVIILKDAAKGEVPIGTEVWSVDAGKGRKGGRSRVGRWRGGLGEA